MSTRSGKNSAEARAAAIEEECQRRKAEAAARHYRLECIRKEREADERQAAAEEAARLAVDTPPPSAPGQAPVNPFPALEGEDGTNQPAAEALAQPRPTRPSSKTTNHAL